MNFKIFFAIIIVVSSSSCVKNNSQLSDDYQQVMIKDLEEEYIVDTKYQHVLKDKINLLTINKDSIFIATISYQKYNSYKAKESFNYVSILYAIKKGKIIDKVKRESYKYHPGYFNVSSEFEHLDLAFNYDLLIPTSSVTHAVEINELVSLNKHDRFHIEFSTQVMEVSCAGPTKSGMLLIDSIYYRNNTYWTMKKEYQFECSEFSFDGKIAKKILISAEDTILVLRK